MDKQFKKQKINSMMEDNRSRNHPHSEMKIICTPKSSRSGIDEDKFYDYLNNINDNVSIKLDHFEKNLKG